MASLAGEEGLGTTLVCGTRTARDGPGCAHFRRSVNRAISPLSSSRLISTDLRPFPRAFSPSSKNSIKVRPADAFAAADAAGSRSTFRRASLTSSRSDGSGELALGLEDPLGGSEAGSTVVATDTDASHGELSAGFAGTSRDRAALASIPVTRLELVSRCFPRCIP